MFIKETASSGLNSSSSFSSSKLSISNIFGSSISTSITVSIIGLSSFIIFSKKTGFCFGVSCFGMIFGSFLKTTSVSGVNR